MASAVTTVDKPGPDEVAIHGWNEWSIFLYIAIVGSLLSFSVWSTFQKNRKILKIGYWLSVAILVFHLIYILIMAKGMGLVVTLGLHLPLAIGVIFFKMYLKSLTVPSNKSLNQIGAQNAPPG